MGGVCGAGQKVPVQLVGVLTDWSDADVKLNVGKTMAEN